MHTQRRVTLTFERRISIDAGCRHREHSQDELSILVRIPNDSVLSVCTLRVVCTTVILA